VTSRERQFLNGAVLVWAIFIIVIMALSFMSPTRTLIPLYAAATNDFWAGINHRWDYYYLPASQIVFTPFAALGHRVGGVFWRLLAVGLLSMAAWQWTVILVAERAQLALGVFLLLLIPGAAGVLRNGQFDAHMWALIMISAAQVARSRNWQAAIALAFALALKPQAIVAVLMVGATWPRVGARLLPLVLLVLALPFLCADREFVWQLYVDLIHGITIGVQQIGDWNDLAGMLQKFGLPVPYPVMTGIRVVAALAAFAIALMARRTLPLPQAAFTTFALSALYLLLFNPRTEGSGYVGLALIAAPLAARAILQEGQASVGALLIVICTLLGVTGLTPGTLSLLGVWLKPFLALLVATIVVIPRALAPHLWRDPRQPTDQPNDTRGGMLP
jgi:hypothetical protein